MNEHERETAFLRRILLYDDTDERRDLEGRIARVQRDGRCVKRATSVAVLFAALAVAALAYGAILQENFPDDSFPLIINVLVGLGLASLVCLMAFAGLLTVYRVKLNRLRGECRRLVAGLLESRLGKPHLAAARDGQSEPGDTGFTDGAMQGGFSPGNPGSLSVRDQT